MEFQTGIYGRMERAPCERPIYTKGIKRRVGRIYVVYGTSSVPTDPMMTISPTLGKHRLVKFPIQRRQFLCQAPWVWPIPPGGKPLTGALEIYTRSLKIE